jgi:hypothetical protein
MHAVLSQSAVSSRKYGDIWTHIGMRICAAYAIRLDNATSRKGLNARQAAFANKQYKSHRRVGLPSDIIKSLAIQDA